MTEQLEQGPKIRPEHRERLAFVYVRQSSLQQVRTNLESQRRQYAFADQAGLLGWSPERVVVVDEDQGRSGAVANSRAGFGRVVGAVARGEVGIVMSLEISRLSRNDADWQHLVYLCRWSDTLIADEHGVYDPANATDRIVLGIRGQVSEMERDATVHRMVEARWNKARRGEAFTIPPAGYEPCEKGGFELSSDEAVQAAIRRVFDKFDELGAARQVFLWWREQGLPFPVRNCQAHRHPVDWKPVSYRVVYGVLRHPIYAGAYAFGRSHTRKELDPKTQRLSVRRAARTSPEEWPVLIKDHHPAYISFDKYVRNQQRLRGNCVMGPRTNDSTQGAAREGKALLQGLLRCGRCGRRMYVNYGGDKAARTLQYRCSRGRALSVAGEECQLVGGKRVEAAVVAAFLQATEAAGVEAAELAGQDLRSQLESDDRAWRLQLEKAQYEMSRAERQFMAVEPENRTVARELERRWNERLAEYESLRTRASVTRESRQPLTEQELTRAGELARQLDAVWNASTTSPRDRKLLLRALIEEVQLQTDEKRHLVRIVWKGGAATDREVVRVRVGHHQTTPDDTIAMVRKLAEQFDDAQIARILHRQGRRSGRGLAFTKSSVRSLRGAHQIPVPSKAIERDEKAGPFTADEAARELGVTMTTVHRWLRQGLLVGEQVAPRAPWRILLSAEVRRRLTAGDAPEGWLGLQDAARRLGMSKSMVAYLVKQGKVPAVRTTVGNRECWRIDVSAVEFAPQRALFDQKRNAARKDP